MRPAKSGLEANGGAMTMDDSITTAPARPSLARRIVAFPLTLLIIAVAMLAAATFVTSKINATLPSSEQPLWAVVKAIIAIIIVSGAYLAFTRWIERQPPRDYALPGAGRELAGGIVTGIVIFTLVVGIAALAGVYRITGEGSLREFVTMLVTVAIMPAFIEELLFRGILFRFIEQIGGSWAALGLTSALFGAAHLMNPNASPLAALAIALEAGLLLGGIYMLTRRLWAPMGLHAAWNFTQGFVFDVPVSGIDSNGMVQAKLSGPVLLSGGAFGLEASLIAMVVATFAGVLMIIRAVRKGEYKAPMWSRGDRVASQEAVRIDVDRDPDPGAPV